MATTCPKTLQRYWRDDLKALHTTEMAQKLVGTNKCHCSCQKELLILLHTVKQLDFNYYLFFCPDVQCDVRRTVLPGGASMFSVWMHRPGQHGTLFQTNQSVHNQSGASLGEVSGSKDSKLYISMAHYISLNIKWSFCLQLIYSFLL